MNRFRYLSATLLVSVFAAFFSITGAVSAAATQTCPDGSTIAATATCPASASQQNACAGLTQLNGSVDCSSGASTGVSKIITTVVNILSIIVGFVAVIMIIVAGFKYITSSGDSNNINSAKNTLIYVLVGVLIVVMAQAIVHFVVNKTTSASAPCPTNSKILASDAACK